MLIKCINAGGLRNVTHGKIYKVEHSENDVYWFFDDTKQYVWKYKHRFVNAYSKAPSSKNNTKKLNRNM